MQRDHVLSQLGTRSPEIAERFGIIRLAIFGSIARDEFSDGSDLDVLIEFQDGQATLENYMELKFFLEDLFGCKVDLVTETALRKEFRPYVERDLIPIYPVTAGISTSDE